MTLIKTCIRIICATIIIVVVPAILALFFLDYFFPRFIRDGFTFILDILIWIINNFTIYDNINFLLKALVWFLTFWIAIIVAALICIGIFGLMSFLAKHIFKNVRKITYKSIFKPFFIYFAINILFGLLTFFGYLPDAEGPIKFISLFMIMLHDEIFGVPFNGDLFLQAHLLIVFFLYQSGIGIPCPHCNRFIASKFISKHSLQTEEKDITKKEKVRVGTDYVTTTVTDGRNIRRYTESYGRYESKDVTRRYKITPFIYTYYCPCCKNYYTAEGKMEAEAGKIGPITVTFPLGD